MSQQRTLSRNGVPIRLTDERWRHIIEEHCELSDLRNDVMQTVSEPERVLRGKYDELLALRLMEPGKALVVVYREIANDDGFVIAAFLTRRLGSLDRRAQIWPPQV
jgi:hypothetical protein